MSTYTKMSRRDFVREGYCPYTERCATESDRDERCKVNSIIDICLYGHNWMGISNGYEHIISVHVSFTLTRQL